MIIKSCQRRILERLIVSGVISKEESDIYSYGIKQLIDFIVSVVTAMIIGWLFGMIWQSVLFLLAYIPLRSYAGGYHAPNSKICYMMSVVLMCVGLFVINNIELNGMILAASTAGVYIIIFIKAPVESKNKPLNQKEIVKYRRLTDIVFCTESFVSIVAFILTYEMATKCILTAGCMVAMLLLFSDKRHGKTK